MTDPQRRIYLLFCMAGRTEEAEEYRAQCEAKAANAQSAPPPDDPKETEDTK